MRKNLLLTLWLALPLAVFAGLVAWIFTGGADRPRMRAEPVGPGAGDTGGANALGEWLRGRDPNLVERANIARREGRKVDPLWWPGGTRFVVAAAEDAPVTVGWVDTRTGLLSSLALRFEGGVWAAAAHDNRPEPGARVYVSGHGIRQRVEGGERRVTDDQGMELTPVAVPEVLPGETPASAPLTVELPAP